MKKIIYFLFVVIHGIPERIDDSVGFVHPYLEMKTGLRGRGIFAKKNIKKYTILTLTKNKFLITGELAAREIKSLVVGDITMSCFDLLTIFSILEQ